MALGIMDGKNKNPSLQSKVYSRKIFINLQGKKPLFLALDAQMPGYMHMDR
jgi:hypothetical protein